MVFAGHLFRSEIVEAKIINRKLFPVEKAPFETSHKTGGRDLRIHKDLRLTARTPFGAIAPLAGQAPACASAPDKRRACQKQPRKPQSRENYSTFAIRNNQFEFMIQPASKTARIAYSLIVGVMISSSGETSALRQHFSICRAALFSGCRSRRYS